MDGRAHRETFRPKLHAAGLDLGQVEDVVDEGQQVLAGPDNVVEVVGLLGRQRAKPLRGQHARHADDGVQRRAQLVAHLGQKLALGPAGGLGRLLVLSQARHLRQRHAHAVEITDEFSQLSRAFRRLHGERAVQKLARGPAQAVHGADDARRHLPGEQRDDDGGHGQGQADLPGVQARIDQRHHRDGPKQHQGEADINKQPRPQGVEGRRSCGHGQAPGEARRGITIVREPFPFRPALAANGRCVRGT